MLLEETRFIHEDLERLEAGISDRIAEDPKHASEILPAIADEWLTYHQIRDRLSRDHQISIFLSHIQAQSLRLQEIYANTEARTREIQLISTGDPFDAFYKELKDIRSFHATYLNEPVENLERAYKRKLPAEGESATAEIDFMFTGEEAFGKFLDLTTLHEQYLNVPGVKRLSYLQYLDAFDKFTPPQMPIKRAEKQTDRYFNYVGELASYLEDFVRRTQPLEDLDKIFSNIAAVFEREWERDGVPGWGPETSTGPAAPVTEGTGAGIWCSDCQKEFANDNVYKAHLTGKKHIKASAARASMGAPSNGTSTVPNQAQRLKEKAIAEREFRVSLLTDHISSTRTATRVNVERKQGMTERERQQELDAFFASTSNFSAFGNGEDHDSDAESNSSDKIYNPLKLPLAWDGKPIPFWLYKLHGLGVEFACEICGNFVYMGRRAFDKHFSESRHVHGLKSLGISNTAMFREITGIGDAQKLWEKMQSDKRTEKAKEDIVQMEDADGNVMPEKVYYEYYPHLDFRPQKRRRLC